MKKTLKALGVIFVCLILVTSIAASVLNHYNRRLDKESHAYVDEVIPIIVTSWNPKELIDRSSTELLHATPIEEIKSLFDEYSKRLGSLKLYEGSKGKADIIIKPQGLIITGYYFAEVIFEKAPARVMVRTILRDDKWQILYFFVFYLW